MKFKHEGFDVSKVTGYIEKRTPKQIKSDFDKTKRAEELGLIGILDGDDVIEKKKVVDKAIALEYVMKGKEIPKELLERILKYKEEDKRKK